jgi:hypothetical protein
LPAGAAWREARAMPICAWFSMFSYCEPRKKSGLARLNAGLADEDYISISFR